MFLYMETIDNNMQLYLYTSATFPGFATKWSTIPSIKRNGIVETTSSQDNE